MSRYDFCNFKEDENFFNRLINIRVYISKKKNFIKVFFIVLYIKFFIRII